METASTILPGVLALSILHVVVPSHWLPIVALKARLGWTNAETVRVAFQAACAHVAGTLMLGLGISYVSLLLASRTQVILEWVAPFVLIALGFYFLVHHTLHKHFSLEREGELKVVSKSRAVWMLSGMMFLSPCLEVEGYFVLAGSIGPAAILQTCLVFGLVSIVGISLGVWLALKSLSKLPSHFIEHYAGLLSGIVLIACGVLILLFD